MNKPGANWRSPSFYQGTFNTDVLAIDKQGWLFLCKYFSFNNLRRNLQANMKNVMVFLLVGLFLQSLQFSIQTRDSFRYFDYYVDAFHRLTSHKISSAAVNSMKDCAMACLVHWECFSFNLGSPAIAGKRECELIKTDKYDSNSTYIYSSNFHHFSIKVSFSLSWSMVQSTGVVK